MGFLGGGELSDWQYTNKEIIKLIVNVLNSYGETKYAMDKLTNFITVEENAIRDLYSAFMKDTVSLQLKE